MRSFLICPLLLFLAGCGGASGTTIDGRVQFSDGSPLSQGTVVITNDNNTYRAPITSDGSYEAENVASGEYKIAITGTTAGGNIGMQYDDAGNYISPSKDQAASTVNLLQDKFSNPQNSGLTLKVPSDNYNLTVESP